MESGAIDAAEAIIEDLLTIRAGRDNYYFAAEMLFPRHPDNVFQPCQNARKVAWPLLDGLLWRSRSTEHGKRRVNYYIKYILVGEDSNHLQDLVGFHVALLFDRSVYPVNVGMEPGRYDKR